MELLYQDKNLIRKYGFYSLLNEFTNNQHLSLIFLIHNLHSFLISAYKLSLSIKFKIKNCITRIIIRKYKETINLLLITQYRIITDQPERFVQL